MDSRRGRTLPIWAQPVDLELRGGGVKAVPGDADVAPTAHAHDTAGTRPGKSAHNGASGDEWP